MASGWKKGRLPNFLSSMFFFSLEEGNSTKSWPFACFLFFAPRGDEGGNSRFYCCANQEDLASRSGVEKDPEGRGGVKERMELPRNPLPLVQRPKMSTLGRERERKKEGTKKILLAILAFFLSIRETRYFGKFDLGGGGGSRIEGERAISFPLPP